MSHTLGQEIRVFGVEEAERMLPLVRSIVKGMMDDEAERRSLLARLQGLAADPESVDAGDDRASELEGEIESLTARLVDAARELNGLGAELKGLSPALVDFPTLKNGEIAYLCWRYGEDRIAHWHPLEAGYTGRRPIERD